MNARPAQRRLRTLEKQGLVERRPGKENGPGCSVLRVWKGVDQDAARIDRAGHKYDPDSPIEFFKELGGFNPKAAGFVGGFDKGEVLGKLILEYGLEPPLLAVYVSDTAPKSDKHLLEGHSFSEQPSQQP